MNRQIFKTTVLIVAGGVVLLIGLIKYVLPELYLYTENRNFEKLRKKSELDCITMPLHCLVDKEDLEGIKRYIQSGKSLELKDNWGQSAILWALRHKKSTFIPVFLDAGADPNTKDERGISILYKALQMEKFSVADQLIQHGADINMLNNNEYPETALHFCVMKNKLGCVKYLLSHGASKQIKDSFGYTVLDRVETHDHIHKEISEALVP